MYRLLCNTIFVHTVIQHNICSYCYTTQYLFILSSKLTFKIYVVNIEEDFRGTHITYYIGDLFCHQPREAAWPGGSGRSRGAGGADGAGLAGGLPRTVWLVGGSGDPRETPHSLLSRFPLRSNNGLPLDTNAQWDRERKSSGIVESI